MADRLINTSKERGIDEDKINSPSEEDAVGVLDVTPENIEEKTIETPKDLIDSAKEIKIEEMDNKQIEDKYLLIVAKLERKEKLTAYEIGFKQRVDEAVAKAEEQNRINNQRLLLEEKEKELSQKEEFLKEYIKTKEQHPEQILRTKDKDIVLTGSSSIPKLLKFIFLLRKAKKKGGKILVQVMRNKQVLIQWTNKELSYVEFITKDEHQNELLEVTRFNEYIYTYEGTPIPVLFAIQGCAEGYNFFGEFAKDITSEMVSRLTSRAYHAGYEKGAELKKPGEKKSGLMNLLTKFMPVIVIGVAILVAYIAYTIYGDNTKILSALDTMHQQLALNAPRDVNALIVR